MINNAKGGLGFFLPNEQESWSILAVFLSKTEIEQESTKHYQNSMLLFHKVCLSLQPKAGKLPKTKEQLYIKIVLTN